MLKNPDFIAFRQPDVHAIEAMSDDERAALAGLVRKMSNYPFAWKSGPQGDSHLTIDRLEFIEPIVDVLLLCGYSELELQSMDALRVMSAIARILNLHSPRERGRLITVETVRSMLKKIERGRGRCSCPELLRSKWWFDSTKLPTLISAGSWDKEGGRATEYKSHGHTYRTWMPKVRRHPVREGVHVEIELEHVRAPQRGDHAIVDLIVLPDPHDAREARITKALASCRVGGTDRAVEVKPELLNDLLPGRAWEPLVDGAGAAASVISDQFGDDGITIGQFIFRHVIERCLISACACFYFHE